ncbi:hypothetical protein KKF84_13095 [Myxococcota bacterium]|nr:hypothetical protein [Myxococcota bacterium]MBU1536254.1 hypothetical protein [Myxococcota bacterium]
MKNVIYLFSLVVVLGGCKKKEEAKAPVINKAPVVAPKVASEPAMTLPPAEPQMKPEAPAPVEMAPDVEPPKVISSHVVTENPKTPAMAPDRVNPPVKSVPAAMRVRKPKEPVEKPVEPKRVSIVPGVSDAMTPLAVPPPLIKKIPTTATSGLYPFGAPAALRTFMQRRQAKVESCFRKALSTGRMTDNNKYTVVVHCSASEGKLTISNVGGSAARISSFKRCVSRLSGTYNEKTFARSWKFTMHLLP